MNKCSEKRLAANQTEKRNKSVSLFLEAVAQWHFVFISAPSNNRRIIKDGRTDKAICKGHFAPKMKNNHKLSNNNIINRTDERKKSACLFLKAVAHSGTSF